MNISFLFSMKKILLSITFLFFFIFTSCNLHTEYNQYKNARVFYNGIDYQCVAAYANIDNFENIFQKDDKQVTFSFYDEGFVTIKIYIRSTDGEKIERKIDKLLLNYQSNQPAVFEIRGERESTSSIVQKDKWISDIEPCEKEINFENRSLKSVNIRIDCKKGTILTLDSVTLLFTDD